MWRDLAWVLAMLQASRKAIEHVRGLNEEQFEASSLPQEAILRQLTIVGEAAERVSLELRLKHHGAPWRQIAGFRDVVGHDYSRVDLQEVWRIVQEDLPALIAFLEPPMPPEEN